MGYNQDNFLPEHYDDVIKGAMASQITSLAIVYSTVYSGADQSKYRSSASMAFVWGIHRGPVNSPHKWPVTRKVFPFDDVIMNENTLYNHRLVFSEEHFYHSLRIFTETHRLVCASLCIQTTWTCFLSTVWYDDVITWKHFPRYWPLVWGIHRWSPHKGQCAELWCFLLSAPKCWVNNRETGDLRRHRAHHDVIVMVAYCQ